MEAQKGQFLLDMGSDNSKHSTPKGVPTDPDPVSTHLFTKVMPTPCTYKALCAQLSLPTKGSRLNTGEFKPGDRVHLESEQEQIQNFGERLFRYFARRFHEDCAPIDINTAEATLENYVKHMKTLVGKASADRLDFLLHLYVTPHTHDVMTYNSVTALFREVIALYHHLHAKEEAQIAEFGYCITEEPEDPNAAMDAPDDMFVPLKKPKTDAKPTNVRRRSSGRSDEPESTEPPKQPANPAFVVSPSVPKHKVEDVLPTEADLEEKLILEVIQRREEAKDRSKQIEALSVQIVSSIVLSIFKSASIDLESITSAERGQLNVDMKSVRGWILANVPKTADVLLALVSLEISNRLEPTANDLVKKQYQRLAPQPDGVNMEKSQLWNASMIWTMHQLFSLKNVGSFKLLYSSATHGRSLNRFTHHVVGYKSETLFIVNTTKGEIFGAFVSTPWEMNSNYWGNSNCFLFGITPVLAVRHPQGGSGSQSNFAYFFTNKKSFTGKPVGIGFGGVPGNLRLWIDEDMLIGTVRSLDPTYESGAIASNPAFDIASIEVWGSATEFAEAGLIRERKLRAKDAERARKAVAKEGAWNEGADKFIMDLVGKTGHSDGIVEAIQKEKRDAAERERQLALAEAKLEAMEKEKRRKAEQQE